MSKPPKIHQYKNLKTLAQRLRSDINDFDCVMLYAYNQTGKTRLSMEFKDQGKRKGGGKPDTLYFNAYTEDLFVWHNDLDGDTDRYLTINEKSSFCKGLTELALDEAIAGYLSRYAAFDFDINYARWVVAFRNGRTSESRSPEAKRKSLFGAYSWRSASGSLMDTLRISG